MRNPKLLIYKARAGCCLRVQLNWGLDFSRLVARRGKFSTKLSTVFVGRLTFGRQINSLPYIVDCNNDQHSRRRVVWVRGLPQR
jgi:hypothetical protein